MLHLGARAFEEIGGEVVQTPAFVFRKGRFVNYQGTYCRLIEPTTQNGKEEMFLAGRNRYVARQENFSKIPGAPVAYWVGKQVYDSFIDRKNLGQICEIVSGMTTGNNDKYLRRWYEVDINKSAYATRQEELNDKLSAGKYWFPYNKGGELRRWYGNNEYLVNWSKSSEFNRAKTTMTHLYLRRCLTWADIMDFFSM